MNEPNNDWVMYKIHTTRKDLEKNFREYQTINKRRLEREQENAKNSHAVLDTRKVSLWEIDTELKIQDEENVPRKSCRDKACGYSKKKHRKTKRLPLEKKPRYAVFCDESNVETDIQDSFESIEDKFEKKKENKGTCIDEIKYNKCCSPAAERNYCFVSPRPLV